MPRSSVAVPRQIVRDFGTCLSYDGSTSQTIVPSSPTIKFTSAITISTWFFLIDATGNYRIMQKYGEDYMLNLESSSGVSRKLRFVLTDNTGTGHYLETDSGIPLKSWVHVVATYDGATMKMYVNGVLQSATTSSAFTIRNQDGDLGLGCSDGGSDKIVGRLDDTRIYGRAFTAAEATGLYYGIEPDNTNLKAWWKFDEGSGTSAIDSSGNSNAGTITTATYSTDVFMKARTAAGNRRVVRDFGTCLSFAGGSNATYVTFTDSPSLDLTNTFTFAAWIKPTSLGASTAGRILAKEGGTGQAYDLLFGANNAFRVFLDNTLYASNNNAIRLGVWQHIAVTFDKDAGSNQIKFYVNGVASGVATRSTAITANAQNLLIGTNSAVSRTFDGKIDEVKIFNTTLTPTQIADEYYKGTSNATGLALYTKFNEGSGTAAIDSSGTQANGTITGATYSSDVFIKSRTVVA